jgi:hypothetical protein
VRKRRKGRKRERERARSVEINVQEINGRFVVVAAKKRVLVSYILLVGRYTRM